jgi:Flp pilus assembly protein TadG
MRHIHRNTRPGIRRSSLVRRGVAAVEMAFVAPIFVTLTLGMIELGRGIMVGQLMTNAAREAARMAIIDGSTNSSVSNAAKSFMQSAAGIAADDLSVTITTSTSGGGNNVANANPQDLITINLSLPYSKVSWIPPKYLAGKDITSMAAMRHE